MKDLNRYDVLKVTIIGVIIMSGTVIYADAASTSNLTTLSSDGDSFYNYDFDSNTVSSTNVDWPITMLHYDDAEVDDVKDIYFGTATFASDKYGRINDGGWEWDTDKGTKSGSAYSEELDDYVYIHQRIYAPNPPDYMANSPWGNYVVSSTHFDESPWESWHGYSEYAEEFFAYIADDSYTVYEDWASFSNSESYREEDSGSHIWLNDGYATAVVVP